MHQYLSALWLTGGLGSSAKWPLSASEPQWAESTPWRSYRLQVPHSSASTRRARVPVECFRRFLLPQCRGAAHTRHSLALSLSGTVPGTLVLSRAKNTAPGGYCGDGLSASIVQIFHLRILRLGDTYPPYHHAILCSHITLWGHRFNLVVVMGQISTTPPQKKKKYNNNPLKTLLGIRYFNPLSALDLLNLNA